MFFSLSGTIFHVNFDKNVFSSQIIIKKSSKTFFSLDAFILLLHFRGDWKLPTYMYRITYIMSGNIESRVNEIENNLCKILCK